MADLRTKLAAAGTAAALGGLGAVAIGNATKSSPAAEKVAVPPVTEVRTQVIRQTIHRTKREKPKAVATGGPPVAAAPIASAAVVRTGPVAARPAPAAAAPPSPALAPVRSRSSSTGSSGSSGHEAEHENENQSDNAVEQDD